MEKHGFLIIDKATDWTSHDVVAKCRNILGIRKIGHLGTLDPLATGVLVLAVGREATKQVSHYMKADKVYDVEIELGKTSDTYDSEGKVEISPTDYPAITRQQLEVELEAFWGTTMQMPPAFSALKINGQRAYKLARAGKEVKLAAREVTMHGKDLEFDFPFVRFTVEVSSGTYIRSLAHDLGKKLGSGGIMTALRRTRVGQFKLEDAITIEDLAKNPSDAPLIPVASSS
jgi:tRNA pseudouridine55 synthase